MVRRGASRVQELILFDNPNIKQRGLDALKIACTARHKVRVSSTEADSWEVLDDVALVTSDGNTTVALGEDPLPLLDAQESAAAPKGLYVAVAYASTPRHVDGRPVAGSRALNGRRVVEGQAWEPKFRPRDTLGKRDNILALRHHRRDIAVATAGRDDAGDAAGAELQASSAEVGAEPEPEPEPEQEPEEVEVEEY